MRDTTKRKRAPWICAAVIVGAMGFFLAAVLFPARGVNHGERMVMGILAVYGLAAVAVIVGVLAALRQRLKEIDGGEEEDARKY